MSGWAAVANTALNIIGNATSARAARKESLRNRSFQERMSNTANQRQVKDLRKAGLNPILGYSKGGGGAQTPSGSQANIPDMGKSITANSAIAQLSLIRAQAKNQNAQAELTQTQTQRSKVYSRPFEAANNIIDAGIAKYKKGDFDAPAKSSTNSSKSLWRNLKYDYSDSKLNKYIK